MSNNYLTASHVRKILNYDAETGIFTWKERAGVRKEWNTKYAGKKAGTPDGYGYVKIAINDKQYQAHRLAWLFMTGEWPAEAIDHIDTNKSNNKFCNLRPATRSQNNMNRSCNKNNKYGAKGVILNKGRWQAQIMANGKLHYLGRFLDKESASEAYRVAALKVHGEFARF